MKEQIEQLIGEGRLEEALTLLVELNSDAILLKARFNGGKKNFGLGLIDFKEWQMIQSNVAAAALDIVAKPKYKTGKAVDDSMIGLSNTGDGNSKGVLSGGLKGTGDGASPRKVFLSYSRLDLDIVLRIRDFLEAKGLEVLIDEDDLPPGMSIMEFIQQSIKSADAVLSVVSAKSLASGWVGQESVATMYAVWLADKKFIPVRLDNVAFDIDFQIAAQESILLKLKDLENKIKRLRKLGGDSRAFDDDRNRLTELKNNLGIIIQRLKSVNLIEINGLNFEPNMDKVLAEIQKI